MAIAGKIHGGAPSAASFWAKPPACRAGRVTRTPRPASGPARPDDSPIRCSWTLRAAEPSGAAREKIVGERKAERVGRFGIGDRCRFFSAHHLGAITGPQEGAAAQLVAAEK